MERKTITDLLAAALNPEEARTRAVWAKARVIADIRLAPDEWRYDDDGNIIRYSEYGQFSDYGWEIDHRLPTAFGGLDAYANLRPLHWRANRSRGGLIGALFDRR